jgi:hypothetical protein
VSRFLHNLVARHTGREATLEPLLRHPFEPPAGNIPWLPTAEDADREAPGEHEEDEVTVPHPTWSAEPATASAPPAPEKEPGPAPRADARRAVAEPEPTRPARPAPFPAPAPRDAQPTGEMPPAAPPVRPPLRESRPPGSEQPLASPRPLPELPEIGQPSASARERLESEPPLGETRPNMMVEVHETHLHPTQMIVREPPTLAPPPPPERLSATPGPALAPPSAPGAEALPALIPAPSTEYARTRTEARREQRGGERTVTISIGRLEVRAQLPLQTPQSNRTTIEPRTSLRDYIRRRRDG